MATYHHPTHGKLEGKIVEEGLDSRGNKAPNGGYVRMILDRDPGHKYLVPESRVY